MVNPLAWVMGFDYRDGNDPTNVQKYLVDLQSRLCKAGYDTHVRINAKRCLIEVVNPTPPVFRLRHHLTQIKTLPANERTCVPGVEVINGTIQPKRLVMRGERTGTMIAGRTGAGKTQVVLSSIITGCLLNSPAKLALIIGDMKGDCKPLDRLPHLAAPVLTDIDDIVTMLSAAAAEMALRQRRAARGDRSFNGKAIWIVLDEVAGTLLAAGDRGGEMMAAIQQLTMVGRSLGFIVTMATQRIYDVKPEVYSNCGRRFGLKLNTPNDSFSLTGAAGTRLNELRGKGDFEVYDAGNAEGERGQGFFVADPEEEGYTEELQWYVGEVSAQWAGIWTHYRLELPEPDDYEPEAPRPVKRSWQDDDGWDNESGE
jgi:S-DNA-T family DNA segregation ATPase FtsK/SpoIIIE